MRLDCFARAWARRRAALRAHREERAAGLFCARLGAEACGATRAPRGACGAWARRRAALRAHREERAAGLFCARLGAGACGATRAPRSVRRLGAEACGATRAPRGACGAWAR